MLLGLAPSVFISSRFPGSGWNTKTVLGWRGKWHDAGSKCLWKTRLLVDLIVMEYTDISHLLVQIPCHAHGMPHVHESCTSYGHKKDIFQCPGITLKFPHSIHPWMLASKVCCESWMRLCPWSLLGNKTSVVSRCRCYFQFSPTSDLFFPTFIKRTSQIYLSPRLWTLFIMSHDGNVRSVDTKGDNGSSVNLWQPQREWSPLFSRGGTETQKSQRVLGSTAKLKLGSLGS